MPVSVVVSAVSDFGRRSVSHCEDARIKTKINVGVGDDEEEGDESNAAGCEVKMI